MTYTQYCHNNMLSTVANNCFYVTKDHFILDKMHV